MKRKSALLAGTEEILDDVLGFDPSDAVIVVGRQRDGRISIWAAAEGYPVLEGRGDDLRSALINLTLSLLRSGQLPSPFCLHTNLEWELAKVEMEKTI